MSRVEFDQNKLDFAIKGALQEVCNVAVDKIQEITPRDPNRMPKDPSQKVTGNLKRSIGYEKVNDFKYKVGTMMSIKDKETGEDADIESYAGAMEFGTANIPARPFLRKGINDNLKELEKTFYQVTNYFLKK